MDNYQIIILGGDNLTRSVVAEAALKQIFREREIDNVDISSRGLVVLFSEPISPNAVMALRDAGCESVAKRSRELTQEDVDQADLILTAGRKDLDELKSRFDTQNTACMFLGTFIDMEEEIPEVEGESQEAYAACYAVARQAMEAAADRVILEMMTP